MPEGRPHECAGFMDRVLEKAGAEFTVRESRGRDIDAACGQLFDSQEASVLAH